MKHVFFLLIGLLLSVKGISQDWQTDFTKAQELAKSQQKKVVLVFQGSDWCAPCIKLDREIWSTEAFKTYAAKHFVMVKADFPKKKKNQLPKAQEAQNNALAEKYNTVGYFPLVVVFDSSGKVLGSQGYQKKSPEEYAKMLDLL